ncbi:hypothetical protein KP509_13G016000 [Ceratopteris richardii]|uniref:Retrovirus-related Pol polyprotein from transposon TNT 1-94 n=1 Tax=Ceratopteris richardii TaxID=49495 RepID=A0A8T2TFS9_CERRI|nr:hypothetical protein KP509_13G016000 [Ceratopteris richardii]
MLLAGKKKSTPKQELNSAFSMKDLGEAEHILEKYIEKVPDRFNVADAKPLGVPLKPHVKLSKDDCPKDDDVANYMKSLVYASACGSLMYAMVATRPHIAHAMGVSRFMANFGKVHWEEVKSILRYLKGTKGKCLCYGKVPLELKGSCDLDISRCSVAYATHCKRWQLLQCNSTLRMRSQRVAKKAKSKTLANMPKMVRKEGSLIL